MSGRTPVPGSALHRHRRRATTDHVQLRAADFAARSLLEAYLGANAAARVLDGEFRRGTGTELEAALWFCDLRGFTELSDRLPAPARGGQSASKSAPTGRRSDRQTRAREGIFHQTPRKLIASRLGDTVAHGEKGGFNFLYASRCSRCAQWMPSFCAAIVVPSTRAFIFLNATSRAKSGEP